MTEPGAEPVERRFHPSTIWREHRARWTLPLFIVAVIAVVAVVDHLSHSQIARVDQPAPTALVQATGGRSFVHLGGEWSGFNPNTPAGASSSSPALLSSVLPSAYVINSKLIPQVNTDLLVSVEATSTAPLTIQYVINPKAVWSDGVPLTADDFIYAWQAQRGDGVDVDGRPDLVASTLGYRDVASVVATNEDRTVTVTFASPYADWRVMFDHMVPAHIARKVGWNTGFATFDPSIDLSAGPMIVRSISTDGTAVVTFNPSWWGTPSALASVLVSGRKDAASWIRTLTTTRDAVVQPGSFTLASLNAVSSLPDTQSSIHPALTFQSLEFNVKSAVGGRLAARQAIAHALDRQEILNKQFGSIDPALQVSQDHLAVVSQQSYAASPEAGEYAAADLASTEKLLVSMGYSKSPGGDFIDGSGKPLTVRMAVEQGDPWIGGSAAEIVAQLHAAGITVVSIPVQGTAGLVAAAAGDTYDMALVTRVSGPFPSVAQGWYSDGTGRRGTADSQNWSKLDDAQVDELFVQAAEALNPVSGGEVYSQIDDQLWSQMVALPLFGEPGLLANGVRIANAVYNPSVDGVMWNVALWTRMQPAPSDSRR